VASGFRIRDFEPRDYPSLAALATAVYPDMPVTVDELRHEDESRPPDYLAHKIVAEADGNMIGAARYDQIPWVHHPRKFFVHGYVDHGHRAGGVGAALYVAILRSLEVHDPLALRVSVRESEQVGMAFINARGFEEERRAWESELDLRSFDPARFAPAGDRVTSAGIRIQTLTALSGTDPEWQRRYYDLAAESGRDSPRIEPYTYPTFEEYRRIHFEGPHFMPEASFVALDGERYVGLSDLHRRGDGKRLETGFTGVLPSHRGRGIAFALKLRAVEFARSQGAESISTSNDSTNGRMLAINDTLGFKRKPAWVGFVKVMKEDEP